MGVARSTMIAAFRYINEHDIEQLIATFGNHPILDAFVAGAKWEHCRQKLNDKNGKSKKSKKNHNMRERL